MALTPSATHPNHSGGIVIVSLGKDRRTSIPKQFGMELPYCLVAVTPDKGSGVAPWLAICNAGALSHLNEEFGQHLHLLSEHTTYRPTFQQSICEKFSLDPGGRIWLLNRGSHLEVWSDTAWRAQLRQAFQGIL